MDADCETVGIKSRLGSRAQSRKTAKEKAAISPAICLRRAGKLLSDPPLLRRPSFATLRPAADGGQRATVIACAEPFRRHKMVVVVALHEMVGRWRWCAAAQQCSMTTGYGAAQRRTQAGGTEDRGN